MIKNTVIPNLTCLSNYEASKSPVNVDDYEAHAKAQLTKNAFDYYASGSLDMQTLRDNRAAFSRIRFRPRVLRDVTNVDSSTTVLGAQVLSTNLCGAYCVCHTMRANWPPLAPVLHQLPDGVRWFQLYVYSDREVTLGLIRRAEAAGYKAIALTVDTPVLGRREPDVRNGFALPPHLSMANFQQAGGEFSQGTKSAGAKGSGLASYVAGLIDRSLTWDDVDWLRSVTDLPIVMKGIMTAEDAELALQHGAAAIWVSNHGARQLDGALATVDALPEVLAAVKGRVEVYVDGGVRRGGDALKAIALGARAVFVGRPVLYGLAHNGEEGVRRVLSLLQSELALAQTLLGAPTLGDVSPSHVCEAPTSAVAAATGGSALPPASRL